mgnify:CR=1 FL=1
MKEFELTDIQKKILHCVNKLGACMYNRKLYSSNKRHLNKIGYGTFYYNLTVLIDRELITGRKVVDKKIHPKRPVLFVQPLKMK